MFEDIDDGFIDLHGFRVGLVLARLNPVISNLVQDLILNESYEEAEIILFELTINLMVSTLKLTKQFDRDRSIDLVAKNIAEKAFFRFKRTEFGSVGVFEKD